MPDRRSGLLDRRHAANEKSTVARAGPSVDALTRRAVIDQVRPTVDAGRFPIKRTSGEYVAVRADILADGHDVIIAILRDRHVHTAEPAEPAEASLRAETSVHNGSARAASSAVDPSSWRETRMSLAAPGTDEWTARFTVDAIGWHEYAIVAWVDPFETWRHDLRVKVAAGQDVSIELLEGSLIIRETAARAEQIGSGVGDSEWLLAQADALSERSDIGRRVETASGEELAAMMFVYADRSSATASPTYRVWVDRDRARFGAWYEMFPRSAGPDPHRSGTFREACERLPAIADLGFDVVYLPPIHPIGHSFRKGPNNSLDAQPGDPGSPWAIGSEDGGHDAIDPALGTFDDFDAFRAEAERLGIEVALDLAWQCSPDHPWVTEHPEWFRQRPDGTIKYAENPPKKYQDIYPLDFACEDWRRLWDAVLDVTMSWVARGVMIFRVDNPHTKSFGFWEWLIAQVHAREPRVIFLAEAFTRPKLMRYLAKAGFTQSYTYFTWRNTKAELQDYLTELTATELREYFRPNLFANTPDILHEYLQTGGRPAFEARLILAATLGASYGIYSGFELCENRALKPGSEEYLDSEKYQYRKWDWSAPGNITELIARVNGIRRLYPALHANWSLRFLSTDNPQIIAYCKTSPDGRDTIMVVVNLDPHHMQHGFVQVPYSARASALDVLVGGARADAARPIAATPAGDMYTVRDLLTDTSYVWRGEWNYVRLDPGVRQAHIFELER